MATLQRDGFAGYQGGTVMTAPFRVSGTTLKVSVDGGATGIQVGVVGDKDLTVRRTTGFVGCGGALAMGQQLALLKFGLAPLCLLLQRGLS